MPIGLRSVTGSGSRACTARNGLTYKAFFAGVLIFTGFASSSALAQNCPLLPDPFGTGIDQKILFGGSIAAATAIASTINAANTAFLTHSTAFVSAPANPPPDSQGGGVWIRGVGGESTTKSSEAIVANIAAAPNIGIPSEGGTANCNSTFK